MLSTTLMSTSPLSPRHYPFFHIMIKPTGPICNLNCEYCYYLEKEALFAKPIKRMELALFEKFAQEYLAALNAPSIEFSWQGGEPLLMGLDFFKAVIEIEQKYAPPGVEITNSLQTNGTLITHAWAQFFKQHKFLIGLSMDGSAALHDTYRKDKAGVGSFKKVKKGLGLLQKHGVDTNILACVNATTVEHPLEVYKYFRDSIGIEFIQFIPIVKVEETTTVFESPDTHPRPNIQPYSIDGKAYGKFLTTIFDEWVRHDVGKVYVQIFETILSKWMGIPGGLCVFSKECGNALVLEHNGDIYACDHYVFPSYKRGNLNENSLLECVETPEQIAFGQQKYKDLPQKCLECEFLGLCFGACTKNRWKPTRDGKRISILCEGYYHFFKHTKPYMLFMVNQLKQQQSPAHIMEYLKTHELK